MFEKILYKNKLKKIICDEYSNNINIYKNELLEYANSMTEHTPTEEILQINFLTTQKYYEIVFNNICSKLSSGIPYFKMILPLKIISMSSCGYSTDPDNLAAGSIYAFSYWVLTNKKAPEETCIYINRFVSDLKEKVLLELQEN